MAEPSSLVEEDENEAPIQVESLCMHCSENGITTLLQTCIPHFHNVFIMAFECGHCGWRNNELQPMTKCDKKGILINLSIPKERLDVLSRQIVKSEHAILRIPELEFEIPPSRGCLTTVEGVLRQAYDGLMAEQDQRRKIYPEIAAKIDEFCQKLETCAQGGMEFSLEIDDPSGNSFIESPFPSLTDDLLLDRKPYIRSTEQNDALGVFEQMEGPSIHHSKNSQGFAIQHSTIGDLTHNALVSKYSAPDEVMVFSGTCCICSKSTETKMYPTKIPFFKEVIIMSNACESCGYKDAEIRPGGGISPKGKKVSLKITCKEDLNRDVIKSDSSSIEIPELTLTVSAGTAMISTVEGLIMKIIADLRSSLGFQIGDSATEEDKEKFEHFFAALDRLLECQEEWSLILTDPLANSFILPLKDNVEEDLNLSIKEYERTSKEDAEFGIDELKKMEEQESTRHEKNV